METVQEADKEGEEEKGGGEKEKGTMEAMAHSGPGCGHINF